MVTISYRAGWDVPVTATRPTLGRTRFMIPSFPYGVKARAEKG